MSELNDKLKQYQDYFKEDLDAIEEELEKSKGYSEIIDKEISNLSQPGLGMNKGGQHYLIEHIKNAVELQAQRQGLRKDRFSIKKTIMDYAAKDEKGASENTELLAAIEELKKVSTVKTHQEPVSDAELDSFIDGELDKESEEES